jgi:bacillithiol system protein YtxJ
MAAEITKIGRMDDLDAAIVRSEQEPVVLFNHDPWCPISARAKSQVDEVRHPILLIDVSRQHEITREIAQRTGIRHESPQVIVLRAGVPVWSASHYRITADDIQNALVIEPEN